MFLHCFLHSQGGQLHLGCEFKGSLLALLLLLGGGQWVCSVSATHFEVEKVRSPVRCSYSKRMHFELEVLEPA